MNTSIELVQNPVIKQNLKEVGKSVTERLEKLNINGQVATVDTVKALKDLRAQLNKELAEFESQRKFVKEGVMSPYNEFEDLYKTEISDKYKNAGNALKDKIAFVEDKIKAEKRDNVKEYFNELCQSESIDFVTFESVGLDINLSTTEKKYKEQCNEFISCIKDDLCLIDTQEFKAEIIVEYKLTLNASRAIKTVQDRKESERIENERIRLQLINNRKTALKELGLIVDEMTNSFVYNDSIFISISDVENLSKDDFTTKYLSIESDIKLYIASMEAPKENNPVEEKQILQAPVIEEKAELVTASFSVTGTIAQLHALGAYMKQNNITYRNI